MKKILILLTAVLLMAALLVVFVSCSGDPADSSSGTTTGEDDPGTVDEGLTLVSGGETKYQVVYPYGANRNAAFLRSMNALRDAFKACGVQMIKFTSDFIEPDEADAFVAPEYEILLGDTNREESKVPGELAFNESRVQVVGKKLVITAGGLDTLAQAVMQFVDKYMADKTDVFLDAGLEDAFLLDMSECSETGKSYAAMAGEIYDSFNEAYWNGSWATPNAFWDAAEMLETYIDAYEQTKDEAYKEKMISFAREFTRVHGSLWQGNMYNDDIMWICIAFTRITILTGEQTYYKIAKMNFDKTYERAYDTKLGGGLYWTTDNNTKNSCVNCPGAIAACLIGEVSGNEDYFAKAKSLIDWEVKYMYEPNVGKVYDAYPLKGEISKWASTYNQGTFLGACTLLYRHYGEEIYLNYAKKAASYAMKSLTTGGILDNGEASLNNGDLPGFKGILTRWLYRLAKETGDLEILTFLQTNAAKVYENRNADGLVWTDWKNKTPDAVPKDQGYCVFGMSTAVALLFNCQQWW